MPPRNSVSQVPGTPGGTSAAAGHRGASWFETRFALLTMRVNSLRPRRHIAGRSRRAQRLGKAGELAEQRARLARIDHLFHPELFGGAERRAQLVEPVFD